jgi:hypothetical protein
MNIFLCVSAQALKLMFYSSKVELFLQTKEPNNIKIK